MTVVTLQEQALRQLTVWCVICKGTVPSHHATTGSLYADGRQAYACQHHMRDRLQWILGWLTFEFRQHAKATDERPL